MSWGTTGLRRKSSVPGRLLGTAVAALSMPVCLGGEALARQPDEASQTARRSGFTVGASGGLVIGAGRGYPSNDVFFRNVPPRSVQTPTGVGLGSGENLWLGFSVNDSLGISLGASRGVWRSNGLRAIASSLQLRMDVYPLMSWGGYWRDVGATGNLGVGWFRVDDNGYDLVRSDETSAVGLGAFFVPVRFWGVGMGPQLEYNFQFADGVAVHTTVVGWRTAFHAG